MSSAATDSTPTCRICRQPLRHTFINLGMSPLGERYVPADKLDAMEPCDPHLIIGNNVLAHVPDINDFVAGIRHSLKPGGNVGIPPPRAANGGEPIRSRSITNI